MMSIFKLHATLLVLLFCMSSSAFSASMFAPVSGFARSFPSNLPISNATITVLETGKKTQTNQEGRFGPFLYPIGKSITLVFEKPMYQTTQSATIIMPRQGLMGPYHNITFQVPPKPIFFLLKTIIGAKIDPEQCHVATTIIAKDKTLNDIPQGEEDAQATITPFIAGEPFYFGIFHSGPFKDMTNPFKRKLTQTTKDGGVIYFNVPVSKDLYTLSAIKKDISFSKVKFLCRKNVFINISPPLGPMAEK